MNMNKRLSLLVVFLSFFLFNICVFAANDDQGRKCSSITEEKYCFTSNGCIWDSDRSTCNDMHVAQNPCEEDTVKIVLRMVGYILLVAKLVVPLLIIGFGTFDIFKSVIDKDEKSLTKQLKVLGVRIVAGIFIFFLPSIVNAILDINSDVNVSGQEGYKVCLGCVTSPKSCEPKKNIFNQN